MGLRRDEVAVSSVVGTVLMLAVTIIIFGGLSVGVVDYFAERQQTLRAELAVVESDAAYLLVHRGGESVALSSASASVLIGSNRTIVPFSYFTAAGTSWDLGETLCLVGADAACRFPAGTVIRGMLVVAGNEVLLQKGDAA